MRCAVIVPHPDRVEDDHDPTHAHDRRPCARKDRRDLVPVRPEHAAGLAPVRTECHALHHRQIEIDARHDGDDREGTHQGEKVAPTRIHAHADVQNVHRVHEDLHPIMTIDALLAVKCRMRAHIVHDLLAAHAHVGASRHTAALHDAEIERPIRVIRRHRQDLLRRIRRTHRRLSLGQCLPELLHRHGFPALRHVHRVPRIDLPAKEERQPRQRQQQQKERTDQAHPLMNGIDSSHRFLLSQWLHYSTSAEKAQ